MKDDAGKAINEKRKADPFDPFDVGTKLCHCNKLLLL